MNDYDTPIALAHARTHAAPEKVEENRWHCKLTLGTRDQRVVAVVSGDASLGDCHPPTTDEVMWST